MIAVALAVAVVLAADAAPAVVAPAPAVTPTPAAPAAPEPPPLNWSLGFGTGATFALPVLSSITTVTGSALVAPPTLSPVVTIERKIGAWSAIQVGARASYQEIPTKTTAANTVPVDNSSATLLNLRIGYRTEVSHPTPRLTVSATGIVGVSSVYQTIHFEAGSGNSLPATAQSLTFDAALGLAIDRAFSDDLGVRFSVELVRGHHTQGSVDISRGPGLGDTLTPNEEYGIDLELAPTLELRVSF